MGNGENLGAVYREGLSNERAIRAENKEVREGGDYVDIRIQEEPAEQRSQKRPGVLPCPGVCEGQDTRRQRGWSGLRTLTWRQVWGQSWARSGCASRPG